MPTQPTYREPVNEALQWLREHSVATCVGSSASSSQRFVLRQAARRYFDYDRLIPILESVLPDEDDAGRVASLILNSNGDPGDGYLFVFFILLRFHHAQDIESFLEEDTLSDKNLPYQNDAQFPHGVDFNTFCEYQMPFCAPHFRPNTRKHFARNLILPIEEIEPIDDGTSAKLYRIKLHSEFDYLEQNIESNNHYYALKTFTGSDGKRRFDNEVKGYTKTGKTGLRTESLLKYYGTYTYQNEYHIILEYADLGTWENFMKTRNPPERPEDIVSLWTSLLNLAQALHRVHLAYGMHQDINSRNLLLKSRPRTNEFGCTIKLADLGRSYFDEHKEAGRDVLVKDMYGTKENGAPECYRRTEYTQTTLLYIPQTADVWSLGCIYSEAAKWMTEGWAGVQRYRDARLKEVQQLRNMDAIALFHDTAQKLNCVNTFHRDIGFTQQRDDPLTSLVCHGLLNDMLHEDHTYRLTSKDLVQRSENILNAVTTQLDNDPSRNKLKKVRTEPLGASGNLEQQNRRTQSTSAKYAKHVGDYATMVETPMRDMSLSESHDLTASANARGKRAIRAHKYGSGTQHVIMESDEDEDHDETRGQIFDSPKPAPASTFGGPPPPRYTNPRASRDVIHMPSSGDASSPHHTRSDSRISGMSGKIEKETPELTFSGAMHFMNEKKRGVRNVYLPWAAQLKGKLHKRDHVFLLDNSYSTSPYWESILGTFELLSFLVEEDDPNGVEVRFANEARSMVSTSSSDLIDYARTVHTRGDTDMEDALGSVTNEYENKLILQSLGRQTTSLLPLSIYILTDGVWARGGSPDAPMLALTETLKKYHLTRRQVGIQFITFGHNREGLEYMRLLDDMSKNFGLAKDFVDTEPSTGNIWKMLLGAIDDYFDSIDE